MKTKEAELSMLNSALKKQIESKNGDLSNKWEDLSNPYYVKAQEAERMEKELKVLEYTIHTLLMSFE